MMRSYSGTRLRPLLRSASYGGQEGFRLCPSGYGGQVGGLAAGSRESASLSLGLSTHNGGVLGSPGDVFGVEFDTESVGEAGGEVEKTGDPDDEEDKIK